jgi:large subunit ribosomal protein L1
MKKIHADFLPHKMKEHKLIEAIKLLKTAQTVKFDESINVSLRLGVDPKKSDQLVRSTVILPHGTGKSVKLAVIAKGDKAKDAQDTGADFVGAEDLIEKIKGGWTGFDVLVTTPDMMREVGKLGTILGPKGLMPNPKTGTVTTDVVKAVKELKLGKIEFRVDKDGNMNNNVGKRSFSDEQLEANIMTLMQAIHRAKPATAKGTYIRSMYISSTMGPGLKIDLSTVGANQ